MFVGAKTLGCIVVMLPCVVGVGGLVLARDFGGPAT